MRIRGATDWRMVRLRRELSRTVDEFDESGLDEAGEADGFELFDQGFALTPEHAGDGIGQLTIAFTLDELTIEELFINLPMIDTSPGWAEPVTEVSGDSGHRMA